MEVKNELSDEDLQAHWDELIESAVRVGVVEPDGDELFSTKAFQEHIDRMLEEDTMDGRMAIIWDAMREYSNLSGLETAWLVTIGDFMIANNKFATARDGDWHNAMKFVMVLIRTGMAEEAAGMTIE